MLERFQATDQLASLVVSVPGTVEGILAWSMYVEQEDETFRVHLRSKGPTVNDIAQELRQEEDIRSHAVFLLLRRVKF